MLPGFIPVGTSSIKKLKRQPRAVSAWAKNSERFKERFPKHEEMTQLFRELSEMKSVGEQEVTPNNIMRFDEVAELF